MRISTALIAAALSAAASLNAASPAWLEVPFCETPPVMDGAVDGPEWAKAAVIPSLMPSVGRSADKLAKIPTEIRLQWDAAFLYISYKCVDDEIFSTKTERDDTLCKEDVCEVFIDQLGDSMQYIEVQVSPNNVVFDKMAVLSAPPVSGPDLKLDAKFRETSLWEFTEWTMDGLKTASGRIVKDGKTIGWTVEMAIPAKHLMKRRGAAALAPCEMRMNLCRYDWQPFPDGKPGRDEAFSYWTPTANGCPHISPAAMGWVRLVKPEAAAK